MMHRTGTAFSALIGLTLAGLAGPAMAQNEDKMIKIDVTIGTETLTATLDDTAAGRDFASMLPLDITLDDYHGIEKVGDLGRQIDNAGAPRAYEPKAGDITQYRPWSNLAIFLKPFQSSAGLVRIGEFDGPIDALSRAGEIPVRITLAD